MFGEIVAHAAPAAEEAKAAVVEMSTSERFSEMIVCTVIGIATVFALLAIFWGMLELMHVIFSKVEKSKQKKEQQNVVTEKQQNSLAQENPSDDTQIVAVLTAAVACMLETQGAPATSFKIKSFRRTN